ncbi:MAG TPA: hypothetical protein VFN37_05520 [Candidatus Baltobacteraceae bacterium]|nr:hypothetical protein [Candidatus Baltobacteraceae bacterium]
MIFAFRSTLFSAGIPNFGQDWRWPFIDDQLRSAIPDVLRVWDSAGLGDPRVRIVNHPVLWLIHFLSLGFSTRTIMCAGIALSVFFTGAGVLALARALRVSAPVAVCAAITAALGPPMFNKFVAGHWYYMISIAAMPWAFASAVRYDGRNLARAVATGSLIALTALQPQIWVMTLLVCIALFAAKARGTRSLLEIVVLAGCGTMLTMPELYGSFAAHSAAHYAGMQTIPMWEANNSAPFFSAIVGLGYAPGYAERALGVVPWAQLLLWIVPIAACGAAIVRRSDSRIAVFAFAWIFALLLVSGVKGPLAAALQYLFDRFLWASTFRELYHFAEPMWLLAAVLAAVCLDRLRPAAATAIAVIACAGALALWIPPAYAGTLQSWDYGARTQALFSRPVPRFASRFLLTPAVPPLGPRGTAYRGVDPDANSIGNWFPLNSAEQYGPIGASLLLGETDPERYAGWLRAAGVSAVLPRPYLQSNPIDGSPLSPAEKLQAKRYFHRDHGGRFWQETPQPLVELRRALPVVRDPFRARFTDGFILERGAYVDPHDPDAVAPALRTQPQVSRDAWDPAQTWVRADYWWWLDPQIAFWPDAALTWSNRELPIPAAARRNGYAHVVLFAGKLFAGGRLEHVKYRIASWVPVSGAACLRVEGGAALVIEFARVRAPYRPLDIRAVRDSAETPVPFSADCLCASMRLSPSDRWVVLKQSYDDAWRLRVEPGTVLRHVVFAGYGNAWEIQARPGSRAFLFYAPAASWEFLVHISLILWLLFALGSAIALWLR